MFGEKVKRWKREKVGLIIVLALVVCSGCRQPTTEQTPATVPMRVVTDDLGRTVTIPVKITRAVSTAPSVTENIFAVGAGDRLVGVTTFCNYPEEAKNIAKIGDTMNPNMESIIALKPDVVFVSTASQIEAFLKTLEPKGERRGVHFQHGFGFAVRDGAHAAVASRADRLCRGARRGGARRSQSGWRIDR